MPVLVPNNYLVYVINAYMNDEHTIDFADKLDVHRGDATGKSYDFTTGHVTLMYYPRNVSLNYTWRNDNTTIEKLKEWSDIVTSIDVFVTPPVTRADSAQTVKKCVLQPDNWGLNAVNENGISNTWESIWTYSNTGGKMRTVVEFPGLSDKGYADKIANQAAFFRICSIKTDDIAASGDVKALPVDQSAIENVATQEQMKDDYKSHNLLYPNGLYIYNHRANLYGLYERLFSGFNAAQMFPQGDFSRLTLEEACSISKIVVRVNTDNGYKFVETSYDVGNVTVYQLYNMPLFYPDARADRMYVLYKTASGEGLNRTETEHWAEFKLSACNELNGAMHVGAFVTNYPTTDQPEYKADDVVTMYNKIYTSEQDNPFFFPAEAINTVGTGDIIGLAATTRALSQGQFGQYPLMAFTSDGIWALQVASSGTYLSKQPISREVCSNSCSICQLDQSVAFATKRALSKVVESSVASFSDILDGPFFNISEKLPKLPEYFKDNADILQLITFNVPPIEYFRQGRVIYDFVNSRLLVFPIAYSPVQTTAKQQTAIKKAYKEADSQSKVVIFVYSIRDDTWSTMITERPMAVLNAYPYPYVQKQDSSVLRLDSKYDYTDTLMQQGIVLTRTLNFDGAMMAITGFDQLTDAHVTPLIFLFGSNDNSTWHYIGRRKTARAAYLPAHPFRFFRMAVSLSMTQAEKYFQTNLQITQKYQKL